MNDMREIPTPNYIPVIESSKNTPRPLQVNVNVQDLDLFKDIIAMLKSILDDTNIDEDIRDYYHDMLQGIMDKE